MMTVEVHVLEINNLTKTYGSLLAVKNIPLTVHTGSIHGFMGPNGAGKTTTKRCCLGLLMPNSGSINIFNMPVSSKIVTILKNVGYIPGDVSLYNYYTVKQLLDYFEALRGLNKAPLRKSLIERLNLDESKSVKALSKGNRQKVGIILALMHDPDLLILDEPTAGLDPLLQAEFYKLMTELCERGKTIFFSSHILSEVDRICDEVSIIKNGELVTTEHISALSKRIGRKIILKFKDSGENRPLNLPNMIFDHADGNSQIYYVSGDVKQIIQSISNLSNLVDIVLPEPNIEDYVMHFYYVEESILIYQTIKLMI